MSKNYLEKSILSLSLFPPRGMAYWAEIWAVNLPKLMDLFTQTNAHLLPERDLMQLWKYKKALAFRCSTEANFVKI
jgi:hypothetical protein